MHRYLLAFLPAIAAAQAPSAAEIMKRVIANQDQAQAARATYIYDENVFVRLQQPRGKAVREESRLYSVLPQKQGVNRTLLKVEGKVFEGKKIIPYSDPEFRRKSMDFDADITDSFANHVSHAHWKNDDGSNEGDMPVDDWFPLNSKRAKNYQFEMKGEEKYRDFDVYRVAFTGEECWSGEALIEKSEFQPVLVTTAFECKIPKAVTILLGINFSQAGAKITYQRVEKGVWFPATVGGELKLRILFFYARTVAFSATNSGFKKADVTSAVTFEEPAP